MNLRTFNPFNGHLACHLFDYQAEHAKAARDASKAYSNARKALRTAIHQDQLSDAEFDANVPKIPTTKADLEHAINWLNQQNLQGPTSIRNAIGELKNTGEESIKCHKQSTYLDVLSHREGPEIEKIREEIVSGTIEPEKLSEALKKARDNQGIVAVIAPDGDGNEVTVLYARDFSHAAGVHLVEQTLAEAARQGGKASFFANSARGNKALVPILRTLIAEHPTAPIDAKNISIYEPWLQRQANDLSGRAKNLAGKMIKYPAGDKETAQTLRALRTVLAARQELGPDATFAKLRQVIADGTLSCLEGKDVDALNNITAELDRALSNHSRFVGDRRQKQEKPSLMQSHGAQYAMALEGWQANAASAEERKHEDDDQDAHQQADAVSNEKTLCDYLSNLRATETETRDQRVPAVINRANKAAQSEHKKRTAEFMAERDTYETENWQPNTNLRDLVAAVAEESDRQPANVVSIYEQRLLAESEANPNRKFAQTRQDLLMSVPASSVPPRLQGERGALLVNAALRGESGPRDSQPKSAWARGKTAIQNLAKRDDVEARITRALEGPRESMGTRAGQAINHILRNRQNFKNPDTACQRIIQNVVKLERGQLAETIEEACQNLSTQQTKAFGKAITPHGRSAPNWIVGLRSIILETVNGMQNCRPELRAGVGLTQNEGLEMQQASEDSQPLLDNNRR